MAVTIDSNVYPKLWATLTYNEASVQDGLACPEWEINGIVDSATAADIVTLFDTWRATREPEGDAVVTQSIGTTVEFTATSGAWTWTNVPCWFVTAPAVARVGGKVRIAFVLADAAAQLAMRNREAAASLETTESDIPNYGTYSLAGVQLTLTEQPDGFVDGPSIEYTAVGTPVIRGQSTAHLTKLIRGHTRALGAKPIIRAWYRRMIATRPVAGTWFPASEPDVKREVVTIDGAKVTRTVVSVDLRLV